MAIDLRRPSRSIPCVVATLAACAVAQCPLQLQPGSGTPGTDALVRASTMWDPDGAGPAQPRLVVAGSFTILGATLANRIAMLDPTSGTFVPLGSGLNGPVEALAVMSNGDLVAGGAFSAAGGVPAMWLARWNGSAWSAIGGAFHYFGGTNGYGVHALAAMPNGDLVAGGEFYEPTSGSYSLARWNGSAWSGLGSGISGGAWNVQALAVLSNGDLAVAGSFAAAGGAAANSIARWDGSTWSAFGTGLDGIAFALAVLPSGDLVVGGPFSVAGGVPAPALARWNGTAWSAFGTTLGAGPNGISVLSLTVMPGGDLLAGGVFATAGGVPCGNLARWNGVSWSTFAGGVGSGNSTIVRTTAVLANGDVVAGGAFLTAGGVAAVNIARWDGAAWAAFGSGIDAPVLVMCNLPNGDLVFGGSFTMIGGVAANRIARWNGAAWSPLGAGLDGPVLAIQPMPNGDLVAAGQFATAGGAPAANLARWDGTSWTPLGAGVTSPTSTFAYVRSLALLPNGDLVAGGAFTIAGVVAANHIARWNGTAWFPLGSGFLSVFLVLPSVTALATLANGDLVAAGSFSHAGGVSVAHIARWNGAAWSAMGVGWANGSTALGSRIAAMLVLANGDLLAGGAEANFFTAGPLVQRWNGTAWTTLSGLTGAAGGNDTSAVVNALALLPDGDVLAGGPSLQAGAGGGLLNPLVRWDGVAWATVPNANGFSIGVGGLLVDAAGQVRAAGNFVGVGNVASAYTATFTSACPAGVAPSGAGCAGSAGLVGLATTSLPWIGSAWRALATGMPANSFALRVLGLSALASPLPLTTILPQGGPGCALYVTPDLIDVYLPTGPSVATELAIPDSLALVGFVVHQQVTPLVFTASGLVEYTASNALVATIGAL